MLLRRFILPVTRTFQHNYCSMELKRVVALLDGFASPSLAESWDNVGLLVQPYTQREIKTVLLTNDLTEKVMDEAVQEKADLILSYHPPLFRPFKRITTGWKDRIVACCLEKGIAVYSPHTAYDTLKGGVNDWLLKAFQVKAAAPLQQKDAPQPYTHQLEAHLTSDAAAAELVQRVTQEFGEKIAVLKDGKDCMKVLCREADLSSIVDLATTRLKSVKFVLTKLKKVPLSGHGAGRKASLVEPITIQEAIDAVKIHLEMHYLRVALAHGSALDSEVKSVAVCAGSGASVLGGAEDCDLWLTGEMSHHEVLDAVHKGCTVLLAEHSNTERGYLENVLKPQLQELFEGKVRVFFSQYDNDPLEII
ncbi:NIF3-like protein 1 [Chionoecetes opilio]|nr:NIF3-like protein 1 [Chionoecetes opilio]